MKNLGTVSSGRLLDGRRVLVIGGGGNGNGRSISRAVSAAGGYAAIVDINEDRAAEASAELVAAGGSALGLTADVRSVDEIERVVGEAFAGMGGIDILITVVGGYGFFAPWAPVHQTTDDDWDRVFDVNLRYVFRTVRSVVGRFLEQGQGGTIVSVGSLAGVISSPMSSAYGAAKAGLINLARSVSVEYAREGIRMNVLSLGLIPTPASQLNDLAPNIDRIPCGRTGTQQEVADATVFLASPVSAYIAGQNLNIDGAVSARFPMILPNTETFMSG
jgi:3-oxoacyl-[acyl-carrier protein] reductase